MDELIMGLTQPDDKKAYEFAKAVCAESAGSDMYYGRIDDFIALLTDPSSFVRTRGFFLVCSQARWDRGGKIAGHMDALMAMLHDPKPTAVCQCLKALHEVTLYRPELCERIAEELDSIDPGIYKDSMSPLIEKDINELRKVLK